MKATSKLYIILLFQVVIFKNNTAGYGAAIYVDDYTNTAMCLASSKKKKQQTHSQLNASGRRTEERERNISFFHNIAN